MDDLEQQQPPVEVVDDDPAYASGRRRVLQSPSHQLFEFGADGFTLTASTDGDDKDDVEHKREERSKAAVARTTRVDVSAAESATNVRPPPPSPTRRAPLSRPSSAAAATTTPTHQSHRNVNVHTGPAGAGVQPQRLTRVSSAPIFGRGGRTVTFSIESEVRFTPLLAQPVLPPHSPAFLPAHEGGYSSSDTNALNVPRPVSFNMSSPGSRQWEKHALDQRRRQQEAARRRALAAATRARTRPASAGASFSASRSGLLMGGATCSSSTSAANLLVGARAAVAAHQARPSSASAAGLMRKANHPETTKWKGASWEWELPPPPMRSAPVIAIHSEMGAHIKAVLGNEQKARRLAQQNALWERARRWRGASV